MNMKVFADMICREVGRRLGEGVCVEVRDVRKNNGTILHGLLARKEGCNVAPTIYLDTYLEAYKQGIPFGAIVRRVLDAYQEDWGGESVDMGFFRSFEQVRDRICCRLIGRERNGALLEEIPHIEFLDLAVCFYYAYRGGLGDGMIQINNSHMEMWGSNMMELLALSKRNTPRLFPWACCGIEEVLTETADGSDDADFRCILEALCEEVPMKILSNERRIQGAVCMLYPGVLKEMADRIGGDFFIIPSSVHEVILLPDTDKGLNEALKQLIWEVNRTKVAPEEVLSDALYRYDRANGRVMTV